MHIVSRQISLLIILCAVAPCTYAKWKGEVGLGAVATTGNTDTVTANFAVAVKNDLEHWRHRGRLEAVRSTDSGEVTVERFLLDYQANYKLHAWDYVFTNLRYDRDLFSGYAYQTSETAGYGREWSHGEKLTLELQGGGGLRQSRPDGGEDDNEGIVRGAFLLKWQFSEHAEFGQSLTVESGETNTLTQSITALKSTIIGNLGMSLNINITHNSNVPPVNENTNSLTSINLVYNF